MKLKLKASGIKESSPEWFVSYLQNRDKYTCGHLSDPQPTNSGVPQGSILGPLLFVCYINDLPNHCAEMRPYLFANNTALAISDKSINTIQTKLQQNFNKLIKWFAANKS